MAKLKVTCRLDDYSEPSMPSIIINSHWNDKDLVVLEVGEKIRLAVGSYTRLLTTV